MPFLRGGGKGRAPADDRLQYTRLRPKCVVQTNSPTVIRYRRAILRMLLSNYYDAGYKRRQWEVRYRRGQ